MRTIKFRAWDKKNKKWLEVFNFILGTLNSGQEDVVIMQFTGLKDKNGKEIWEGDVVSLLGVDEETDKPYEKKLQVNFCAGCFVFEKSDTKIPAIFYEDYVIEVIGNVWESPELLVPKPIQK